MSQLQERNALLVTENEALKAQRDEARAKLALIEWCNWRIEKGRNTLLADASYDAAVVALAALTEQPVMVSSESFNTGLSILNEVLDDCGDSERGLLMALSRMGIEVEGE